MEELIQINTIHGFEEVKDYYYCDKDGNIWSNAQGSLRKLKCGLDSSNYLQVSLILKNGKSKRILVHRIICSAYHNNVENKPTVNHINHIRNDNRAVNLEWATHKDQMDNICVETRSKKCYKKILIKDVSNNKVIVFQSVKQCADYLEVNHSAISNAIRRNSKCKEFEIKLLK